MNYVRKNTEKKIIKFINIFIIISLFSGIVQIQPY